MQALAVVCSYNILFSYTLARVCKYLRNELSHIKYGYLINCRLPQQIIRISERINNMKYNYIYALNRYHAYLIALYSMLTYNLTTLLVTVNGSNPFKDYLPELKTTTWINLKKFGTHYYERIVIMYSKPYNCPTNQHIIDKLAHSNVWYFGEACELPLLFTSLISSNGITRIYSNSLITKLRVQLLDIDYLLGINNYVSTAEFARKYPEIAYHYIDNYIYRYNQLLLVAAEKLLLTEPSFGVSLCHQASNRCNGSICKDCTHAIDDLSRYTQTPYSYRIMLAAEVTPKILEYITFQCHYKDISIVILYSKYLQGKSYTDRVLEHLKPYSPTLY